MKRWLLLFTLFLLNYFFSPSQLNAQAREEGGVTDMPFTGDIHDDGNNTLGQTYNNTACGLNYTITSLMITPRYTGAPGSGYPASMTMSMPSCIGGNGNNVLQAYIWWGLSYTSGSSTSPVVTVTNPLGNTFNYTGTLVGQSGTKCWGEIGTRTFRANVTSCINTSGAYTFTIAGNTASEVDGATFVIIYRDPLATYTGTMIINDGCQTFSNGTPSTMTVSNFTACANSVNGSGFSCTGDQQNNISPPTHTTTINSVTQTFPNLFWNTDIISTNVTAGQTSVSFTNTPNTSDCWSWNVIGYYYQTTGCATCTVSVGLTSSISSQNATCAVNNGWAAASVSGGSAPYTYAWNTSPVQTTVTATGLGAGNYTCTVTDATGCNMSVLNVTVTQPSALSTAVSASNTCSGESNGSASVTAQGGTPGYSYSWSPSGGTGSAATNLAAGTYTVVITDANGCTASTTAVVASNTNPVVSSLLDYSECPFDQQQTVFTNFTGNTYNDVTVCASGPSGYLTDNVVCTDPNNVNCAGNFKKDSLISPYATMGATLTGVSIQSVYVSLDSTFGNNSRGSGLDNRLWLRSPAGTLFQLASQKSSNNTTTNRYKPVFTVTAPLGVLPNAMGSYNSTGYRADQGPFGSATWIGEAPGASWAGNSNENYTHAAGQWMVYANDQVAGNNGTNQTKITEFCITFRTYPDIQYSWSVDPSSTSACPTYLSSTSIPDPVLTTPPWEEETYYNCTYNLVVTDAMGCTASTSINVFCGTLPVNLLSYSGKNIAAGNKLEWTTASETNNSHFTIQRSVDGHVFTDLLKVTSQAVNGNSTSPLHYSVVDADVKPGTYYYRLKQTDINGDAEEIGVVAVVVKPGREIFSLKPNPAKSNVDVTYECQADEMAVLQLYNNKGMLLKSIDIYCRKGENTMSVDLSSFADGLYLVTLSNAGNVYKARLVKAQ
jgi:hypothetical protein